MTWHYETTIAEVVHRLRDDTGESVWGVENRGFDADHDATLGTESVLLPTGETEVLLVDPLPGGFVLDAVRAVHGLTEAEIHTLLRGCFAELAAVGDQASRLGLDCFALDAEGRPRLIPGVRHRLETSVRRAIGELVYHAAYGSPWSEALLPVDVALAERSAQLRALVADLLDDDPVPPSGGEAGWQPPSPRYLRSWALFPHRCRCRSSRPPATSIRRRRSPLGCGPLPRGSRPRRAALPIGRGRAMSAPVRGALRSPWRRSGPACRGRFTRASIPVEAWGADPQVGSATATSGIHPILVVDQAADERRSGALGHRRVDRRRRPRGLLVAWSTAETPPPGPEQAAAQRPPAGSGDGAGDEDPTDEDVIDRLGDLCAERARALGAGDGDALAALTVPGSSAAAADELIDLSAYAGGTYTVTVEDVTVVERTDTGIRVAARMTTSAEIGGQEERFEAEDVVFTLTEHEGAWRIAEVAEV
ncbi:hypothetical protein K4X33_09045 [Brevibacterium casei]|nr:hypothetical protein K4X33_09045 [Brevibacterium casei]